MTDQEKRVGKTAKVYAAWPVSEGSEFSIEFVHSVNKTPVTETFAVAGNRIRVLRVRFYGFGAGMESDLAEGLTLSRDGDALVISGYDDVRPSLNYIVGTVSDHILRHDGGHFSLRDLCGKNAHVTISVK